MDAEWLKASRAEAEADRRRLSELKEQQAALEKEIARVGERIRSWEILLGQVEEATPTANLLSDEENKKRQRRIVLEPAPETPTGLRDAIRVVLKTASRGLRPKEVVQELLERNFRPSGTTDFSLRVSSEMWRMSKVGSLRNVNGVYVVNDKGASMH